MKFLILTAALNCSPTEMINKTSDPWNDQDKQHLDIAKKRCGEIYKNSACVRTFIKRTTSDYSVICSKEKK